MIEPTEVQSYRLPTSRAASLAGLPALEPTGSRGSALLRLILIGLDGAGTFAAWMAALVIFGGAKGSHLASYLTTALFVTVVTVPVITAFRLYRASVCAVRSVELSRLAQAAMVTSVGFALVSKTTPWSPPPRVDLIGGTYMFLVLAGLRSAYTSWLRTCRARGLYCREVCILGESSDASRLLEMLKEPPALGYRVAAVRGEPSEWVSKPRDGLQRGRDASLVDAVRRTGAPGVIVAANAVDSADVDDVVRQLVAARIHVQISTGMSRVGQHRLRANPLSGQLVFYVEPRHRNLGRSAVKRALDIGIGVALIVVSLPILLAAMLLVLVDDGAPVFYRQERVGRDGEPFSVIKLRTMVRDASSQVESLADQNERKGPLFKLGSDPRVTRVGRFLRMTSIDELPQLFNVLLGHMSLVGPRPALPAEAAQFDDQLRERFSVRPGITGLWQVEARDNPSFQTYRRLDLFYVDNWTISMDLMIIAATCGVVLGRAWKAVAGGREMVLREAVDRDLTDPIPGTDCLPHLVVHPREAS